MIQKPPPNESRLSCGAKLKCSQTECYHNTCRMFSEPIEDGRRQLQALVRQHGTSGPALHPDSLRARPARLEGWTKVPMLFDVTNKSVTICLLESQDRSAEAIDERDIDDVSE
jgi:hypothetical protein